MEILKYIVLAVYAIVCIGFLMPAEKFVRKMFGFDKATTVGPLGAAAGGEQGYVPQQLRCVSFGCV